MKEPPFLYRFLPVFCQFLHGFFAFCMVFCTVFALFSPLFTDFYGAFSCNGVAFVCFYTHGRAYPPGNFYTNGGAFFLAISKDLARLLLELFFYIPGIHRREASGRTFPPPTWGTTEPPPCRAPLSFQMLPDFHPNTPFLYKESRRKARFIPGFSVLNNQEGAFKKGAFSFILSKYLSR